MEKKKKKQKKNKNIGRLKKRPKKGQSKKKISMDFQSMLKQSIADLLQDGILLPPTLSPGQDGEDAPECEIEADESAANCTEFCMCEEVSFVEGNYACGLSLNESCPHCNDTYLFISDNCLCGDTSFCHREQAAAKQTNSPNSGEIAGGVVGALVLLGLLGLLIFLVFKRRKSTNRKKENNADQGNDADYTAIEDALSRTEYSAVNENGEGRVNGIPNMSYSKHPAYIASSERNRQRRNNYEEIETGNKLPRSTAPDGSQPDDYDHLKSVRPTDDPEGTNLPVTKEAQPYQEHLDGYEVLKDGNLQGTTGKEQYETLVHPQDDANPVLSNYFVLEKDNAPDSVLEKDNAPDSVLETDTPANYSILEENPDFILGTPTVPPEPETVSSGYFVLELDPSTAHEMK